MGPKRTDRHALLGTQYFHAEAFRLYQGVYLISDDMGYRPLMLPFQILILLAMYDINAQTSERFRRRVRRRRRRRVRAPLLPLPSGGESVGGGGGALGSPRFGHLGREHREFVYEVLGA